MFQSTRPVWGATLEHAASTISQAFQSTRPVWGATGCSIYATSSFSFQSTRPVWGATDDCIGILATMEFQSTRPVWGATQALLIFDLCRKFQSTRPVWGATVSALVLPLTQEVSIHAPRVGRDGNWSHDFPLLPRIYGHSPPQIRFSRHLRPTPLLRHDSRTYIFTFCFLFTSPSHSVMNAHMMIAASKS